MTALKPIEWRHVKGVSSTKYPVNIRCAHPECSEPIDGVHHIFPRSYIGNGSYFVEFTPEGGETQVIPHVVGLCGSGTTGHHGDVEEHKAWIKLEEGEFVWYERGAFTCECRSGCDHETSEWRYVGPLNPQPGSREGRSKRRRAVGGTPGLSKRRVVSVRLPDGVTSEYWDTLLSDSEEVELMQPDTQFNKTLGRVTNGKLLIAILERFTGRGG